ncbi:hypothetical protein IHE61_30955 [Streptomyces sp. GKU 257-1]|nr:hypothetical protein [Streptomyces sp. GKU 257-1]
MATSTVVDKRTHELGPRRAHPDARRPLATCDGPMTRTGAYGRLHIRVRPVRGAEEAAAALAAGGWALEVTARTVQGIEVYGRDGAVAAYGATLPALLERLDQAADAAAEELEKWARLTGARQAEDWRWTRAQFRADVFAQLGALLGPERPARPLPPSRPELDEAWTARPRLFAERAAAGIDVAQFTDMCTEAALLPPEKPLTNDDVNAILAEARRQDAKRHAANAPQRFSVLDTGPAPAPSPARGAPREMDLTRAQWERGGWWHQQTLPLYGPGMLAPGDRAEMAAGISVRRRMLLRGIVVRFGPRTATVRSADGRTHRIPHEELTIEPQQVSPWPTPQEVRAR